MSSIQMYESLAGSPATNGHGGGAPAPSESVMAPSYAAGALQVLRQTGGRPISFHGRQLGHRNSYRLGTDLWFELNLYQTDDSRFIADIRTFHKSAGAQDSYHVRVCDSLDEAVGVFEGFDARREVSADFDPADPALAPAEILAQAATLRYRLADAEKQYKAVLSDLLYELNGG